MYKAINSNLLIVKKSNFVYYDWIVHLYIYLGENVCLAVLTNWLV